MRRLVISLGLAVVLAACTNGGGDTTAATSSTTPLPPLTTLAPQATTTTSSSPATTTTTVPVPTNGCAVEPRTSVEGYQKGCDVLGFEILAAGEVADEAVVAMSDHIFAMLVGRPDLLAAMNAQGLGARVIGVDQRLPSLPEFTDVYDLYPGIDWNRRARSFPGTDLIPLVVGAEENLRCLPDDRYTGEDIFVREFAISLRRFGLSVVDPATDARIEQAYATAIAEGRWVNTLAEINSDEYWAEGVQSYFDANLEEPDDREPNSSHNQVDTRGELHDYDRTLHDIAFTVFGNSTWRPCSAETG